MNGKRSWGNFLREPALLLLIAYTALVLAAAPTLVWTTERLNDLDEGQHFYALDRLAKGQVPYCDFYYLYGPSILYSLYVPFKLLGQNLAAALFAIRVFAPILSLLVVFIIARLVLRTARGRFILMASVLAANAQTLFWCPGYRVWLSLLAIGGFAACLFRPAGLSSFLWGVLISFGAFMSADMTVMTATCLVVMTMFAIASSGLRIVGRPLIFCLSGILFGSFLLWSGPLLSGGIKQALSFNTALLDGTNWYGGLPLPWPWEVFRTPFKLGIFKIYWYFTVLICTVLVTVFWNLRSTSDHDLPNIRLCKVGFVVASLILARVVLGRVSQDDYWRLSYAAAPLLILMVMYCEHITPKLEEILRVRFFAKGRVARYVDIYIVAVMISVSVGLAVVPFLSIRQACQEIRATLSLIKRQIYPSGSVVLVSGIRYPEASTKGFWREYAKTNAYLAEHLPPGAYLYVCPWGPYNSFLNMPNPTRVDILDNVAPNPQLRKELIHDLMTHKPEHIILRHVWNGELSCSNNPELVTREIRAFVEQYYTQVAQFGTDKVWQLKGRPGNPFKPVVVGTWTEANVLIPKSQSVWPPRKLLTFKRDFPRNYEADTVELKLKVTYPFWARSLAKGLLRLKIEAPTEQLYTLGIPSDGQIYAIRFYLNRIMPLHEVEFEMYHPGPFNFAPKSVQILSLSLYRTGGRAFE